MPGKIGARRTGKSPTIFGRIKAKNVTFLVDISGSMYRVLDDMKDQLIRAISDISTNDYDAMFNLIAFSDDVYPWASSLMPCTPRTVSIASDWIRGLESKTSTNTQDALMLALQDEKTDAVYLVTDGLPNDKPSVILNNVKEIVRGRKVHCFYISGSNDDRPAIEFLRILAEKTGGSLHLLAHDESGKVTDIREVCLTDSEISSVSSVDFRRGWIEEEDGFNGNYHEKYEDLGWKSKYVGSGMASKSSNLAASLMSGKRVLARRDVDGFFYLGIIVDVTPLGTFKVKFDDCPAIFASHVVQDTALRNIISYEDALRNDISVGEKVLAPVGDDGKYKPGTVVEGVDIRKTKQLDFDGQFITVSIYDGCTVDVPCGVSVKISEDMNKRIRDETYLSESLRKSMTNGSILPYEGKSKLFSEHADNSWPKRHHPRVGRGNKTHDDIDSRPTDLLRSKIERQIEEGEMLLQKLYLEDEEYAKELGYAPSLESGSTYDSYKETYHKSRPKIDQESFRNWREKVLADTFRSTPKPTRNAWVPVDEPEEKGLAKRKHLNSRIENHNKDEGYHKHRLELLNHWEKNKHAPKYSPYVVYRTPGKEEKATQSMPDEPRPRRRKKITFRTTTIKSQNQPRIKRRYFTEPRPTSDEYHAFDGIPFPPSTDRKFKSDGNPDSWTVEKSSVVPARPVNIITHQPVEYFANGHVSGNDTRSASLRGTRNAALEKRQQDIANERAKKERIFKERQEYHRVNIERRERERQDRIRKFREGEELNKQKSRGVRENFIRYQREKEEKAQRYKQERLDAMRDRRMNRGIQETNRERSVVEAKEKLTEGHSIRESQRRNAFEASLDNEIKMQEKKLERLRKIHASRLDKEDTRTSRAFQSRDLRNHVEDQSRQMYRASVLP